MKKLEEFIVLLKNEEFIEAHEVLEDKWREYKKSDDLKKESYILKGLINGATALALWKMGRLQGAYKVWGTFEKYRPLIKTIKSPHTKLYQSAQSLLDKMYEKYIAQV